MAVAIEIATTATTYQFFLVRHRRMFFQNCWVPSRPQVTRVMR